MSAGPRPDPTRTRLLERVGLGTDAWEVWEDDHLRWLQLGDGTVQSMMHRDRPAALALPYTRAMAASLLFEPRPQTALLLGLGGGSLARFLGATVPGIGLRAAELDPEVVRLARTYFALPPGLDAIAVADARIVLADQPDPADLVLVDLFGVEGLPRFVLEPDLYRLIRMRLSPAGIVVANLWVRDDDEFLGVIGGMREVFDGRVLVIDVPGFRNLVAIAFASPAAGHPIAELRARARELRHRTGVDFGSLVERLTVCNLVHRGALVP
ncbi:MAG: fused MFS/spermidine synthase [Ectothiorhodospiraceae bacterium]|nr:fused MFS/spermidine synthase [Ectothiorhodospiraceae bacterium]